MLTPAEVINTYFLETRCQLLEIGAMLDRLDRAAAGSGSARSGSARSGSARSGSARSGSARSGGDPLADERLAKIYQSLRLLAEPDATPDRAERLLNLFSDPA